MKRILLMLGILILSIGLLAACGGDDDDGDTGNGDATPTEEVSGGTTATEEETEADSTGTEAEGTGTEDEDMGTGTEEADGTGTEEDMGTGTEEADGTASGEGETFAIGDPITISDDLTVTVEGTTDSVETSVAEPEEGMMFFGVEVSIEGESGGMTDLPTVFQDLTLEDSTGETYDLNLEATTEMLTDASGGASAEGTASAEVTLTLVFEVPEDVTASDLTLMGETGEGEMFMVPLEEGSSS